VGTVVLQKGAYVSSSGTMAEHDRMPRTREIREKERCGGWRCAGGCLLKRAQKGEAEVSGAGRMGDEKVV